MEFWWRTDEANICFRICGNSVRFMHTNPRPAGIDLAILETFWRAQSNTGRVEYKLKIAYCCASLSRLPMNIEYACTFGSRAVKAATRRCGLIPYRDRLASLRTMTIASSLSSFANASTAALVPDSVLSPDQQNWE